MSLLRRWLALCLLAFLPVWPVGVAQAASVLFIATSNVPPGKFHLLADLHAIELQRITLNMQISLLHTLGRQAQECASKAAEAEDAYLRRLASIPPGVRDR